MTAMNIYIQRSLGIRFSEKQMKHFSNMDHSLLYKPLMFRQTILVLPSHSSSSRFVFASHDEFHVAEPPVHTCDPSCLGNV